MSSNENTKQEIKILILKLGNELIKSALRSFKTGRESIPLIIDIVQDARELAKQNKEDKAKYESALKNLIILGGFQAINPIEGLVSKWRDKTYKWTGSFSSLVPIFGIYNKNRYKKIN